MSARVMRSGLMKLESVPVAPWCIERKILRICDLIWMATCIFFYGTVASTFHSINPLVLPNKRTPDSSTASKAALGTNSSYMQSYINQQSAAGKPSPTARLPLASASGSTNQISSIPKYIPPPRCLPSGKPLIHSFTAAPDWFLSSLLRRER